MQTFLPYRDFFRTAHCLRDQELTSQISHVIIILDTLHEIEGVEGWRSHPSIDMWRGYEAQLCTYGLTMCSEAWSRNWNVHGSEERIEWHLSNIATVDDFEMKLPPWMQDETQVYVVERTSRSVLIGKDREYYSKFEWNVQPGLHFYFPKAA